MIGVELRYLEYFVAVVEERNFTRAAARLQVVQSAVSAGMKSLEAQLHAQLVHRSPRDVHPTEAGRALLPRARETLAAARSAVDAVDEVRGGIRGEVRVGVMASLPGVDLPAALGRMHAEHPQVRVRLSHRAGGSRDLAADVAVDRLDLALLSDPGPDARRLQVTTLATFGMVLVVPPGHALLGRDTAGLDELADETFVDFPVGYGSRAAVDRAFAAAGRQRYVSIEVTNAETAATYVRHGLGVAILPEAYTGPARTVGVVGPGSEELSWSLALATPRGRRSAAASALVAIIAEVLASGSDRG